jgi:hypothetical protein
MTDHPRFPIEESHYPNPDYTIPPEIVDALAASARAWITERGDEYASDFDVSPGEWAECSRFHPPGDHPRLIVTGGQTGWMHSLPCCLSWMQAAFAANTPEELYSSPSWPPAEAAIAGAEIEAACFVFDAVRKQMRAEIDNEEEA